MLIHQRCYFKIFRDNNEGGAAHFTAIVGAYEYDTGDELEVLQSVTAQGEFSVATLDSIYTSVVNCNESLVRFFCYILHECGMC